MAERILSLGEEIANSITHGVGLVASIVALPILLMKARSSSDPSALVGAAIYGLSLILLYGASTVYHALPLSDAKRFFRVVDHSAIYLLIAGTYTPFALIALGGTRGWWLFGTIWTLAAFGGAMQFSAWRDRHRLKIALYLIMGWLGMITFTPLAARLHPGGTTLLVAGGIAYTLGVPFHLWTRLRYHNALWHAFVLTGSVLHFFAVLLYVLRPS